MIDVKAVLSDTSLKSLAENAGVIWDQKKSKPARRDWWAPCPFHQEATASFHVTEKPGRDVFRCFGCGAQGDAIDFVQARDGVDYTTALRALASDADLDPAEAERRAKRAAEAAAAAEVKAEHEAAERLDCAWRIWRSSGEIGDADMASQYLRARGVLGRCPAPRRLRLHPDLKSPCGHRGPALVALVGRHKFLGIHRTWITATGRAIGRDGKKIPKAMLGHTGHMFGAPVTLAQPNLSQPLVVGEGIETTMAAVDMWRSLRGNSGIWGEAALSLGALTGDGSNEGWLPPREQSGMVIVAADPKKSDPAAAHAAAARATDRIRAAGYRCAYVVPLSRFDHDQDFADLAQQDMKGGDL